MDHGLARLQYISHLPFNEYQCLLVAAGAHSLSLVNRAQYLLINESSVRTLAEHINSTLIAERINSTQTHDNFSELNHRLDSVCLPSSMHVFLLAFMPIVLVFLSAYLLPRFPVYSLPSCLLALLLEAFMPVFLFACLPDSRPAFIPILVPSCLPDLQGPQAWCACNVPIACYVNKKIRKHGPLVGLYCTDNFIGAS